MKFTRRNTLLALLFLCLAAWGLSLWRARSLLLSSTTGGFSQIEEGLYQGGRVAEPPPGTNAVLNLTDSADQFSCETVLWEPIPDREPAPSLIWLRTMVLFVDEQRKAGKTVYVHCHAGVSRSGLVVTAYEMHQHGWSRDAALAFVRSQRPSTNPNPAFMRLLLEWEKALKEP